MVYLRHHTALFYGYGLFAGERSLCSSYATLVRRANGLVLARRCVNSGGRVRVLGSQPRPPRFWVRLIRSRGCSPCRARRTTFGVSVMPFWDGWFAPIWTSCPTFSFPSFFACFRSCNATCGVVRLARRSSWRISTLPPWSSTGRRQLGSTCLGMPPPLPPSVACLTQSRSCLARRLLCLKAFAFGTPPRFVVAICTNALQPGTLS